MIAPNHLIAERSLVMTHPVVCLIMVAVDVGRQLARSRG